MQIDLSKSNAQGENVETIAKKTWYQKLVVKI